MAVRPASRVREAPASDVWRVRARAATFDGPLLLDTHVWLWYVEGRETAWHRSTRTLLDRGAVGLITTHDLALAHIADNLGPRAANVHFADQLIDGKMTFDFRMRPGVVRHSNAIELMRAVGLPV